jgi:hypothetical protein
MILEFSLQILEKCSISNTMKILPVGANLFHADERPDGRDKPLDLSRQVAVRNFANAPKNESYEIC